MRYHEQLPITKNPVPLGGKLAIAGTYRYEWGTFELTQAAEQDYSVIPARPPDTEPVKPISNLPKLRTPQVHVRFVSWHEAGAEAEADAESIPATTVLGLHRAGITVGVYFHGDFDGAIDYELASSMHGHDVVNPLVAYLADSASRRARAGIETWSNKLSDQDMRRSRRLLGIGGMAIATAVTGYGAAIGAPLEGAIGGLATAASDIAVIDYFQTDHEQKTEFRRGQAAAIASIYAQTIERDIHGIFAGPPPLQE